MESFFPSLKIERTARKMYRSRDEAKADVFEYIERASRADSRCSHHEVDNWAKTAAPLKSCHSIDFQYHRMVGDRQRNTGGISYDLNWFEATAGVVNCHFCSNTSQINSDVIRAFDPFAPDD
jgi:hypothetical protein